MTWFLSARLVRLRQVQASHKMKIEMSLVVGLSGMVVGVSAGAIVEGDSRTASDFLFFEDGSLDIVEDGLLKIIDHCRTASMKLEDRRLESSSLVEAQQQNLEAGVCRRT